MQAKHLKTFGISIALLGLSQWSSLTVGQTAEQLYQRTLAATCANCHGTDGKGVENSAMPMLNTFTSEYLLTQMRAFKSGAREGTIMPQLAKGYTDEQLIKIANQLGKKQ